MHISAGRDAQRTATKLIDAVAGARPGDTIRIEPGTYRLDKPLILAASGSESRPIRIEADGAQRAVLDFSDEPEAKDQVGVHVTGNHWELVGIEVVHAGYYGFLINGSHNVLERCVSRENRSTGTQIDDGGSYNLLVDCESFRNFDVKTRGENADGFAAKHAVGPGNVFRGCRAWQNSDDGWDVWMAPHPIRIEDCVAFRNGFNIWGIDGFQGDGNGFKLGGNYVGGSHIVQRCVAIEQPLNGFDQNHNVSGLMVEDCLAIRCATGFSFPEVPQSGRNIVRRNTSFGSRNVLEHHMIAEGNRWLPEMATGNLGPPPRPGHRDLPGAGAVPTTQETPMVTPGPSVSEIQSALTGMLHPVAPATMP